MSKIVDFFRRLFNTPVVFGRPIVVEPEKVPAAPSVEEPTVVVVEDQKVKPKVKPRVKPKTSTKPSTKVKPKAKPKA